MKFNNRNVVISPSANIGRNVRIGDNTVINDNVEIGDDSVICNDCVIGEPLNDYYSNPNYQNPRTVIGPEALIRSHAIIYGGVEAGAHFQTGHRATIREGSIFGRNCSVGTLGDIQGHSTFGDYVRLHSNVHIGQRSTVGSYVFVYPFCVFTNDLQPPSNTLLGPTVGDFTQVAVCTVLFPGIKVGSNCLLGANSAITSDVADFAFVTGNPAKFVADVRKIPSIAKPKEAHYPWMNHFSRGMPWDGIGYAEWQKRNG